MFDLTIIGGGLGGPALAIAAAQSGLRVAIVDPGAKAIDGRSYALSHASHRLLRRIGIWETLTAHAQPMDEIKVSDARPGRPPAPQILHFMSDEIDASPMGFMVEDQALRTAYDSQISTLDITQIQSQAIGQTQHMGYASTLLANGETLNSRLIAGCDGRGSKTAERAGIKRIGWDYQQTALVCALRHEMPHHGIAHQMFLPGGPLAILPLTGNRCSIVWSVERTFAERVSSQNDADFIATLKPVFGEFLGDINLEGPRFSYPLTFSLAENFVADRVALVADAAHGMHPVAGQGLNAGLRDIAALIEILNDARQRGEDIGGMAVLRRYERWRRFEVIKLMAATDLTVRSFSNDFGPMRFARDMALGAINGWPALRRTMIREAAGLSGTTPELMRA